MRQNACVADTTDTTQRHSAVVSEFKRVRRRWGRPNRINLRPKRKSSPRVHYRSPLLLRYRKRLRSIFDWNIINPADGRCPTRIEFCFPTPGPLVVPANLPNGMRFKIGPDFSGSDQAILPIRVRTTVGFTLFVRIPYFPNSIAMVLVIWFTAPLDAQYVVWSGMALCKKQPTVRKSFQQKNTNNVKRGSTTKRNVL